MMKESKLDLKNSSILSRNSRRWNTLERWLLVRVDAVNDVAVVALLAHASCHFIISASSLHYVWCHNKQETN